MSVCLSVCLFVLLPFSASVRPSFDLVVLDYFDHGCDLVFFLTFMPWIYGFPRDCLYICHIVFGFFFDHVEGYVCCFFLFMTSRFWFGFYGCVQYGMITRILLFFLIYIRLGYMFFVFLGLIRADLPHYAFPSVLFLSFFDTFCVRGRTLVSRGSV